MIKNDFFKIKNLKFRKYINKETIEKIVDELASKINMDYRNEKVVFIVVLKGSIFFASDLLRKMNIDCVIDTVRASSYGDEIKNSKLRLSVENIDVKDKNVIIIEDIVDTGNTLGQLIERVSRENPKSLEAVSFLSKPEKRKIDLDVKYIGKEIPPLFVIGYGLDYAEQGRHLPDIYILDEN